MKKILLLSVCLMSGVVFAQGFYQELEAMRKQKAPETPVVEVVAEDVVVQEPVAETISLGMPAAKPDEVLEINNQDLFDIVGEQKVEPVIVAPTPQPAVPEVMPEDKEEAEVQKIEIAMQDMRRMMLPSGVGSYCFGTIRFENFMKKTVTSLEVQLTFGDFTKSYAVSNLVKGEYQDEELTMTGENCKYITDMPKMEVSCTMEDASAEECKKKVIFIPLLGGDV